MFTFYIAIANSLPKTEFFTGEIMKHISEIHQIDILMMIGYEVDFRSQVVVSKLFNQRYPQLLNISQGLSLKSMAYSLHLLKMM